MLKNIIEALIFSSGNSILEEKIITSLSQDFSETDIVDCISKLKEEYSGDKGFILITVDKHLQFQSNPIYGDKLSDILQEVKEKEISKTLLQVLAIIAYKQPITKSEIEEIRGTNADYVVSALLNLRLIAVIGRKETVGRPLIYGTTQEFLKKFALTTIEDLPDYEELLEKIRNNFEKYYAKTKDLYRENPEHEIQETELEIQESIPDFIKGDDYIEVE